MGSRHRSKESGRESRNDKTRLVNLVAAKRSICNADRKCTAVNVHQHYRRLDQPADYVTLIVKVRVTELRNKL